MQNPNTDTSPKAPTNITNTPHLPFVVQPQLLQDLGVNLYTKLDRVLVEFLANSHDADAKKAIVEIDFDALKKARSVVKREFELEEAKHLQNNQNPKPLPLEARTLGDNLVIRITDYGIGMSESDLKDKFLVVSRRRREVEHKTRTDSGRLIMGRKGLGKLAGFGVAHKITVYSKTATSSAHRIVLDYDLFSQKKSTGDLQVPLDEILDWQNLFPGGQGTIIELSKLVYSGIQKDATVANHVAKNFRKVKDFSIFVAGVELSYAAPTYAFLYPDNGVLAADKLAEAEIKHENGTVHKIKYRICFYGEKKYLGTGEYGLRIYCHNRLASQPELFGISSSVDGYIYHTYMEGAVEADFIDDQEIDYIATDRQGLRWENAVLQPLYKFLREQIVTALSAYAEFKQKKDENDVSQDEFTRETIKKMGLHGKLRDQAYKSAKIMAKGDEDGIKGDFYKTSLPVVINALGHGEILSAISTLAKSAKPEIKQVIGEIVELTRYEYDGFINIARGRLDGIESLKKIVNSHDFKKAKNEKDVQKLFEECPWLIDPTFYQFMTADSSQAQVRDELQKHLEIGTHVPAGYDPTTDEELLAERKNKRPDLVFLLGNSALRRIVIVELKAPNTPLLNKHLNQLKRYIDDTKIWLKSTHPKEDYIVRGILIGCRDKDGSKSEEIRDLKIAENERPDSAEWVVRDISEVLKESQIVHKQFIDKADAIPDAKQ